MLFTDTVTCRYGGGGEAGSTSLCDNTSLATNEL